MTSFVASNDAGGAEALSDFLRSSGIDFDCLLTGPAIEIFSRKFSFLNHVSIDKLHHYDHVFISTSALSDTEFLVLERSKKLGLKSTVIIDAGGNMKMRFMRKGVVLLPDEFIVCLDEVADEIVSTFGGILDIKVNKKFYMGSISVLGAPLFADVGLYLTEPISKHALEYFGDADYFGFNEFDALEGFLSNFNKINPALKKIILRHHPDESVDKYLNFIVKFNLLVSDQADLISDLKLVNNVYGCSNNAMYIAYLAGRSVTSVLPSKVEKYGSYDDKFHKFLY